MRRITAIFLLTCITVCAISSEALVNVSVVCVRTEPRHGAELLTQADFGMIRRPIVADKQLPGIIYTESSPQYTSPAL